MVYYNSDEHVDTISYSSKQVDASNKPIKKTHIVDKVCNLSVGVVSEDPAVIGIGIIRNGITQGVINGGTNIVRNLVTNVLTNFSKIIFDTNTLQLNMLQSEAFMIGMHDKSVESNRKIICTSNDSRNIRGEHISRIDTPGVNEDIWRPRSDMTLNVLSCTDNVNKFYTLVYGSTTQERNLESSQIKEVGVKSIFPELGKNPDSSVRVNLTNSIISKITNFIHLGHSTVETADIRIINFSTSTRSKKLNGLWRGTEMDDRLGKTHNFETMSETTAYRNHINNLEIETR